MQDDIIQLGADDFDEAVDLLNLAFSEHGPHDFRTIQPAIYQPTDTHMRQNHAIKRDGRIVAIVGLFPIEWRVGDRTLRVAGIGGVCVHPACRRQGLMCRLMDHALQQIQVGGFHLSYLGGQRQRYGFWGWEVAGSQVTFTVDPGNVRHDLGAAGPPPIALETAAEDGPTLAALQALHDQQVLYCPRPAHAFADYLNRWHHKTVLARDGDGQVVGYFSALRRDDQVTELVAATDELALQMVRLWVEQHERRVSVKFATTLPSLVQRMGQTASVIELTQSGNWQVFDWTTTLDTLLRVHHGQRNLPAGSVALHIRDQDTRLRMTVDGGEASCVPTEDPADLSADSKTMMRLLFGPLVARDVLVLSPAAAPLDSWCPLPLGLSRLDCV